MWSSHKAYKAWLNVYKKVWWSWKQGFLYYLESKLFCLVCYKVFVRFMIVKFWRKTYLANSHPIRKTVDFADIHYLWKLSLHKRVENACCKITKIFKFSLFFVNATVLEWWPVYSPSTLLLCPFLWFFVSSKQLIARKRVCNSLYHL